MRAPRFLPILLAVGCIILLARSPTGFGDLPIRMPSGEKADPPRGLSAMCRTQPSQCESLLQVQARGDKLDQPDEKDKVKLLAKINQEVNGRVHQMTDANAFGQAEIWRRSGRGNNAVGDCEDIALEKMYALGEKGFPSGDLFLAVGYARGVGLHTVLIGRTSQGDMVLDNRTPYLAQWNKTEYSWIIHQEPGSLTKWRNVSARPHQDTTNRLAQRALEQGAPTT